MSFGKHDDVGMVDLGAVEKDGSAEHVQSIDRDQDDLLRLGKKPVLKVSLRFFLRLVLMDETIEGRILYPWQKTCTSELFMLIMMASEELQFHVNRRVQL